jgi:hypothetical protein
MSAKQQALNLASGSKGQPNITSTAKKGGKAGAASISNKSGLDNQVSSVARKGNLDLSQSGGTSGKKHLKGVS